MASISRRRPCHSRRAVYLARARTVPSPKVTATFVVALQIEPVNYVRGKSDSTAESSVNDKIGRFGCASIAQQDEGNASFQSAVDVAVVHYRSTLALGDDTTWTAETYHIALAPVDGVDNRVRAPLA